MPQHAVQAAPIPNAAHAKPEILTPQQVAERLQVPVSWVYEQSRNRSSIRVPDPLPHMKLGRYLRFDWNRVLAWMERQSKAAA
jgi:predicted DNA-binding transcriptional regulator AlpA